MHSSTKAAPSGSFEEQLESILARTSYFRVETDAQRELIYRMRYDAYRQENAILAREDHRFSDPYDRDANAATFGVNIDGLLAGSIRLHVTSHLQPRGPAIDTYGDVLRPLLEAGESWIDPSRFVTNPEMRPGARLLPFAVTRLACMAAEHHTADWMLATVRVEHVAFYSRFCRLRPLTEPRAYPFLTKPLMLLGERNEDIRDQVFTRYPVFSSNVGERLALFGRGNDDAIGRPLNDNVSGYPIHVA